jgi:hypothetical protein
VTTAFEVSFDYRCPFAKNIHLHVVNALRGGADFDVTFVPWTLSQGYRAEGAPDVWNDPAYDDDLLSLAAGESVRDQQPDLFLAAHEALFRARHEQGVRLVTLDEITGVLAPLGVDMDMVRADIASRRPHEVIAQNYQDHSRYEVFGVPTFVVGSDATFVRYMTAPTGSAAQSAKIIDGIVSLIAMEPELNEFKHTRLPQ